MNVALWVVQGLLALAFLVVGASKIARPKDALYQRGLKWVEDYSTNAVKLIGAAEVLGALGLILPRATGIATVLTPIAALGFVVLMVGAIITHSRRKETIVPALVLLVLALFVAIGRFTFGA